MPSSTTSNRRSSFPSAPPGGGPENAPANRSTPTTASSAAKAGSLASSASRVRWQNLPPSERGNNTNTDEPAAAASSKMNTSVSSSMTPSKRIQDKFANVASGKNAHAVFDYHFEGTPFSHKKRRKHHNHEGGRHSHQPPPTNLGEGAAMAAAEAADDTFAMGANATAEILNMNSNPLDESALLSVASKASNASNASSAASSEVDVMNQTTLSDTHELSTSNFVLNAKHRGVLAENARKLGLGDHARKTKKKAAEKGAEQGKPATAKVSSPTMTLSGIGEMTGLTGMFSLPGQQPPPNDEGAQKQPQEGKEQNEEGSPALEFTSLQRSRTPRKSGDVSLLTEGSDTRSAGGLDDILGDYSLLNESVGLDSKDEDANGKEEGGNVEEEEGADSLTALIEGADRMLDETEGAKNGRAAPKEPSFAESTASQGQLDAFLEGVIDGAAAAPIAPGAVDSTPEATANASSRSNHASPLCPSPGFVSGQKPRMGSNLSLMRKSLGGDVTKVRELTASLRKEKKGRGRMSLPALAGGRRSIGGASVNATEATASPARKDSEAKAADSPARNTRSAAKSPTRKSPARKSPRKKSPVPPASADSPARNTRSANKSPTRKSPSRKKSPVPPADSPARNTRSGARKESPAARSLFGSPDPVFREITSKFDDPPRAAAGGAEPPFSGRKRPSNSPGARAAVSATGSLSKEYPFLSLSPGHGGEDAAPSNVEGTQTLAFGDLMADIHNEVGKNDEEDGGEIAFSSRHSARKKRRETADTAELRDHLLTTDATSPDAASPEATLGTAGHKTPKSILSTSKKRQQQQPASNGRKVGFGAPKAAEYNVGSPSDRMTPLPAAEAREKFPVPPEAEEQTTELEGDLERLVARDNDTSILLDPIDEGSREMSGVSGGAEPTETLETNVLGLVGETTAFSEPSISSVSSASKNLSAETEEDMSLEQTQTVQLAALLGGNQGGEKATERGPPPEERTEPIQLEGAMESLPGLAQNEVREESVELTRLASLAQNSPTRNIEGTLASLAEAVPGGVEDSLDRSEDSHTMELDNNLEGLLEGAGAGEPTLDTVTDFPVKGIKPVPREDDTMSELGMHGATQDLRLASSTKNTAGHELRTIAETPPAEPVDLTLDEVVGRDGIDCAATMESRGDVFLDALGTASSLAAASCPMVRPESERVLAQICEDIESQLVDDDPLAMFGALLEDKEDAMRGIQRSLRSNESAWNERVAQLIEASMESQLGAWDQWLTEVAAVYDDEMATAVLDPLQKDEADISAKSSQIDQNREQVALPLLIRSARRAAKAKFDKYKSEATSCEAEVSELEAQVEEAERQLNAAKAVHGKIDEVAKLNEESESLYSDAKGQRKSADSSYYKFFNVEKLHNWVVTGSSDSSIGLAFRGVASETSIQLSFKISASSAVAMSAKLGSLPRATNAFLSGSKGSKHGGRFHPAVSGFLKNKMELLCSDLKDIPVPSASEMRSVIQFAELRVARIEEAAKEIDEVLRQCRDSFLQPSETLANGYDFTAYLSRSGGNGDRLHVAVSLPDAYPFAPLGLRLHSTSEGSFDTESMTQQLKQTATRPGFGALTRAVAAVRNMVR